MTQQDPAGQPAPAPPAPADPSGAADAAPAEAPAAPVDPREVGPTGPPGWTMRRSTRTAASESWDLFDGDRDRVGTITVQHSDQLVDGVIALGGTSNDDSVRALLGWVTDVLALDALAGPGGTIHWTAVSGQATDYWRRAPGRRLSGAETDLAGVRQRVEAVLTSLFGGFGRLPEGDLAVDVGTVRVFVATWLEGTLAAVRIFAITNVDIPPNPELPAFLLSANYGLVVGRFSVDPAGRAVWFDHVLAGEDIDEGSLARAISTVAGIADRFDEQIKEKFGGRTFREEGSPDQQMIDIASAAPGMAGGYL